MLTARVFVSALAIVGASAGFAHRRSPCTETTLSNTTLLPPPSHLPLRILPLGDSITFGYDEPSGNSYRRNLQCFLHSFGFPVALVGSIHNGDWPDNASDGFVLHTIAEIQDASMPEIQGKSGPPPNVVLVHAGTVDFSYDVDVSTAPARLEALVGGIASMLPDALVVVSELIINANETVQGRVEAYNREVPGVVDRLREGGATRVVFSEMGGLKVGDLLSDGTHPNAVGYYQMAENWLRAVVGAYVEGLITPAVGDFADWGLASAVAGLCEGPLS